MRRSWRRRVFLGAIVLTAGSALAWGLAQELQTSRVQALVVARLAKQMTFSTAPGASPSVRFPNAGPYDTRLGYTRLPSFTDSLAAHGFTVEQQARSSPKLASFIDRGGFAVYHEKTRAGLTLVDRRGNEFFVARHPERVYDSFEAIPPLIVETLLFIENRELLDPRYPRRNPAVEWDRLAKSLARLATHMIDPSVKVPGASTLATQIEKYRHSQSGQTSDIEDKLRQMVSASMRAYLDGADTTEARRRILVDYLNSLPISSRPGFGEVHGLGDGLWAWYGTDFEVANHILSEPDPSLPRRILQALVYKQAVSLLLAQRRPSHYLVTHRAALGELTDSYLRLLGEAGVIDTSLRDLALAMELRFSATQSHPPAQSFIERKAANAVRTELLSLLGLSSLYELDRLDLTVETTLDMPTQERVTEMLRRLDEPDYAERLGLKGFHLLGGGDPGQVVYSFVLYERGPDGNYVRAQVDNLDGPFDINEGAKLELGSTAKLRTLITYLEIVADLHRRYAETPSEELKAVSAEAHDALTRWATRYLATSATRELSAMLDAAMEQRYSASPNERFFTNGGIHTFANYDRNDDHKVLSVAEALRRSVNLVFIRLMRDIVGYTIAEKAGDPRALLDDPENPGRQRYLESFADHEGRVFLNRFFDAYRGLGPEQALARLSDRARPTAASLTVVFRSVRPEAGLAELEDYLQRALPQGRLDRAAVGQLYERYGIDRFTLADRGYLARVHPLELWLVGYLQDHPQTSRRMALDASAKERQEVYAWLFKTSRKSAQDRRIRIMLEREAFERIHRAWRRLGYPFESLVPSFATAIGSSGDRPSALAELMGIIVNEGVRWPTRRIAWLHFAAGTPYETVLAYRPEAGERVLSSEVAVTVHRALIDVVERGTGRRVEGAFVDAIGAALPVGGKTGTGDNRFKRYGTGGRLLESRVVNRTATFAFFIGDRFFGTVTTYVSGPEAAEYRFTSALPAQLLKSLAPALEPLLQRPAIRIAEAPPRSTEGDPSSRDTPRDTLAVEAHPVVPGEALDGSSAAKASMATNAVAALGSGDEGGGSAPEVVVSHSVSPFVANSVDEAIVLPIDLRPFRDDDVEVGQPGERPEEEGGAALLALVGKDLDVSEAEVVVNGDGGQLPTGALYSVAAVAGDALAGTDDAVEPLGVEMEELGGPGASVAQDRRVGVEKGEPEETSAWRFKRQATAAGRG